jgi:hypothetical protein
LLSFDIGHPNDLLHFSVSSVNEVPEVVGGARKRRSAEVSKASFDLGMGKTCVYHPVEPLSDFDRRILGRE